MSQIVYTELEAFPIRWPYLQLEPLDTTTTQSWSSEQTFNTSIQTYTLPDTTSPEGVHLFGANALSQTIARHANYELWDNFLLSIQRVGNPGPLKVEIYNTVRATNTFLTHGLLENFDSPVGSDSISTTTWRAVSRTFPRKIRIAELRLGVASTYPDRYEIRTTDANGAPTSTIIVSGNLDASGVVTFSPPLELDAGRYAFIAYRSTGTGVLAYNGSRVTASDFGSDHSTWVSTNSGSTWSSAGRTNYALRLRIHPLAYLPNTKLGEYEVPESQIGTTMTYQSLYRSDDSRRIIYPANELLMFVFSAPQGNSSNYYVIRRGTTYDGGLSPSMTITDTTIAEHSGVYDGSTWTYRPHDLFMQKQHLPPISYQYTNTYFIGPGSYAPKISVRIRAVSGTVGARPVGFLGVLSPALPRRTTTSTTITGLSWSSEVETKVGDMAPLFFYFDGNGSYNQIEVEPRIYYDKNPITPRDFGFTEIYLMRVRAEAANTLVRVNDRTNLFFATSGDSVVIDPNFRAYISKIQVITGRATCDFLGVI
ncbi:MAG: hypothetical protein N3H84_04320 [Candidatus Caldarchaeum sp.]|nr:hypothetical protein [Candidatus Caldarchaeum sp.]